MADARDLTTGPRENSSSTAVGRRETADFECNICFDLAKDPVIILCGHLHCWPCIYKWLKPHSQFHQCPVCKALIAEEKLIPLYGTTTDHPRLNNIPSPGAEIPHRPPGRGPGTAPPPPPYSVFGRIGGVFTLLAPAALVSGVLSPVFRVRFDEFSDGSNGYGGASGFNYGYTYADSIGESGLNREGSSFEQGNFESLKKILVFILVFLLIECLSI